MNVKSYLLVALSLTFGDMVASSTVWPIAPAPTFTECCDLQLMDANRQVAIETDRVLPTGTFRALRVRLCTTDPVAIQVWTRVSATEFRFKWQTQFTATDDQISQATSIINLQNNPVTIELSDRLGFYNPSNGSLKIPIPYNVDQNAAQYLSQLKFTGSQFVSGQQILLDDLRWPRTSSAYIAFCSTSTDCPDPSIMATTVAPGASFPGPPGPPGPCCPVPVGPSCDPGGKIKDNLDDQDEQIRQLEDDIRRLREILDNLINSNVITGTCPEGFISGVYGIGSCYIIHKDEQIQMAQAVIKCRDNYQAGLLKIQSDLEDRFIKNHIFNNTNPADIESYWTAGMYNIPLRNWYWYDDNTRTKAPYTYRNWQNGMEPAPLTIYDVCSVFTTNVPLSQSYWQKNECTLANYYICEIPKKCL